MLRSDICSRAATGGMRDSMEGRRVTSAFMSLSSSSSWFSTVSRAGQQSGRANAPAPRSGKLREPTAESPQTPSLPAAAAAFWCPRQRSQLGRSRQLLAKGTRDRDNLPAGFPHGQGSKTPPGPLQQPPVPPLLLCRHAPLCRTAFAGLFPARDSLERCWWLSARHSTSARRAFNAMAG